MSGFEAASSNQATAGSSSRSGKSSKAAERRRSRSRSPITENTSLAEVGKKVSKMVRQGKVMQQTTPHGVRLLSYHANVMEEIDERQLIRRATGMHFWNRG